MLRRDNHFGHNRELGQRTHAQVMQIRKIVLDTNCLLMSIPKITPYYKLQLIQADADDNKFVDCAFSADASCIVSNDAHFKVLDEIDFPKIVVLRITEFIEYL